jgi:hypothetical protein
MPATVLECFSLLPITALNTTIEAADEVELMLESDIKAFA